MAKIEARVVVVVIASVIVETLSLNHLIPEERVNEGNVFEPHHHHLQSLATIIARTSTT